MTKRRASFILFIFSICWVGWTLMALLGGVLGDCMDVGKYSECWAAKEYGPAIDFWRGLAVQLLAVVIYLLYTRRRAS